MSDEALEKRLAAMEQSLQLIQMAVMRLAQSSASRQTQAPPLRPTIENPHRIPPDKRRCGSCGCIVPKNASAGNW